MYGFIEPDDYEFIMIFMGQMTVGCNVYLAMATGNDGDGRPRSDRSGVRFSNELQTSWNLPESFVTLSSPEVVVLDTSVVPDVLGLRAHYPNAEPYRVLPVRAPRVRTAGLYL